MSEKERFEKELELVQKIQEANERTAKERLLSEIPDHRDLEQRLIKRKPNHLNPPKHFNNSQEKSYQTPKKTVPLWK